MHDSEQFKAFLDAHKLQLQYSAVPESFWKTIFRKITDQDFDSGAAFILSPKEDEDTADVVGYSPYNVRVICEDGIKADDSSALYLIDHAWTFTADRVTEELTKTPRLLERLSALMRVDADETARQVELVRERLWKFAQTYSLNSDGLAIEDKMAVWYVMDELGSSVAHSDTPNFRVVPFLNVFDGFAYSLLYPLDNVGYGDVVTRDYVENISDRTVRSAALVPWKLDAFVPCNPSQTEPDASYFLSGHAPESLPEDTSTKTEAKKTKLTVFSQYSFINEYLTNPSFAITQNEADADILWLTTHFKSFRELSATSKLINQFPFEYILNIKDLLAAVCRRSPNAKFLPLTYNLKTELNEFVSLFRKRAEDGLDNHWIVKPFNLARALDTHVTDNLDFVIRLRETGPKIAQKYIEDPVLYHRPTSGSVKFDIRYVIMLRSVSPTSVYIYTNFFLRFANVEFALTNLEEYERHFTVMNYSTPDKLYAVTCAEFKREWEKQYPSIEWDDVEADIFEMFREIFRCATSRAPPFGIAPNPQSRALYAADVMLAWDSDNDKTRIQPKILEINWMPDCQRACEYYPDFYNDIFSCLFLDNAVETCIKIL